ncbi:NAD(P)-binding protein [Aspergillus japonicus CBS 114.51]|uniref:NAD(P)-binding protein n=1 Tax=Aspergillus japonicus CBS 114.51 TaxID=1448312 RepID=A0A8T8WSP7_ASPJA|nr:NAD(P)-binding protein [Aspergillus japonicus CBS 114.51]RAH78359.1 NAD(P)-binding protein [Aspergillus japonicus CBS 114.51]
MSTALSFVARQVNTSAKLENIVSDSLRSDEALVEMHATGVCPIDFACMNGTLPAGFPSVFGHEGGGVVLEVGRNIKHQQRQDKVLLALITAPQCDSGHPAYYQEWAQRNFGQQRMDQSLCLSTADGTEVHGNFFGQSSFARHAIVSGNPVVKVPWTTPLSVFAPHGCSVQTGAGAILNTMDVQPGKTVAIFGVGSVGMSAVMAAKMREAGMIIAVDLHNRRLGLAKELGATHAILGSDEDVVAQIQNLSGSNGVDYSVDCAGVPQVVEIALDCLRTRGKAATVGAPTPGKCAGVDIFAHLVMGRQYIGCCEGDSVPAEMPPYLIEQHAKGQFSLERILSSYPVREYDFQDIKDGVRH